MKKKRTTKTAKKKTGKRSAPSGRRVSDRELDRLVKRVGGLVFLFEELERVCKAAGRDLHELLAWARKQRGK